MTERSKPALMGYRSAVAAVGLALAVKVALARWWGAEGPFLLFLGAVLFAAWNGVVGPGLVATALAAADYFFLEPDHTVHWPEPDEARRLAEFLLEGAFISVLSGLRMESAEQARRRAEELRVTLHSIGDSVVVTDRDGRVTFLNPVAEALTGWAAAAAGGRSVGDVLALVDGETGKAVAEGPCRRVLRTGEPTGLGGRAALVGPDGVARPVEDTADPIRGPDGQILRW